MENTEEDVKEDRVVNNEDTVEDKEVVDDDGSH